MPGSNFHDVLTIAANGHISPGGPLGDATRGASGVTKTEVYVWVVQPPTGGGMGAFMEAEGEVSAAENEWRTPPEPKNQHGKFKSGSAVGIAVEVSTGPKSDDPKSDEVEVKRMHWWIEMIRLEDGPLEA